MNQTDNLIFRYLDNEMNEKERRRFEQRLEKEPALRKEVEFQLGVRNALIEEDIVELRDKLQGITSGRSSPSQHKDKRKIYLSVAAIIIALISVGSWFYFMVVSQEPAELYQKYYTPYENVYSVRSAEEEREDNALLEKAFTAYDEESWQEADRYFKLFLENNSNHAAANFYGGIVKLERGNHMEAMELLQRVVDENNNLFTEQSYWYLALTSLRIGDTEEAKSHLTRIVDNEMFHSTDAREILKSLRYRSILDK
ncbi:MAG: hypothetical protein R6U04_09730 [Bacteroidales bacterium]